MTTVTHLAHRDRALLLKSALSAMPWNLTMLYYSNYPATLESIRGPLHRSNLHYTSQINFLCHIFPQSNNF